MAKAKQRFSWTYDHEAGTATVDDTVTGETRTYDGNDLSQEFQDRTFVYGIGKILQDRESSVKADGKIAAYDSRWADLLKGNWESERTGGGLGQVPAYIEVIATLKGWTGTSGIAKAQKAWAAQDDAFKEAFKIKHKDAIAKVVEARKAAEVDTDLDDLM